MVTVIAYTGGWNAPSRVFRLQNYQAPLRTFGIDITECPSSAGVYPPERKWLRPPWALWNLVDRAPDTLRSRWYDLVFLQREMLSTFVTWEPLTKKPRVFDVDDALWDHPRGAFAWKIARFCDQVICGNSFLAEHFSRWNPNVSILPTPVNTTEFCPAEVHPDADRPIIGWMGLPSGFKYLYRVEAALARVLRMFPEVVFRIVSSKRPDCRMMPLNQVQWIPWTPDTEARAIQGMTVGIMPLDDSVFARGKCSYKMLLYMACGVPVVVSPVGMNADVLKRGSVGFGAISEQDWISNLSELLSNPQLRSKMGQVGRKIVVDQFSVGVLAPQLARILYLACGKTGSDTMATTEASNS